VSKRSARLYAWLLALWFLGSMLVACAWQAPHAAERESGESVSPALTPQPASWLAPIDERVWRVLYRRAGWDRRAELDLRAVGDIMLGRSVAQAAERSGFSYPFAQIQALLDGDLALGNLESPLTDRRSPVRPGPYRLPAPPAFAAPLRASGFSVLSLANNHVLDLGPDGLADTVKTLTTTGIMPLGVGPAAAARTAVVLHIRERSLALLSFNDVADPEDRADEGQSWGRAWLDEAALDAVRQARGAADLVVVVVHWGQEYAARPTVRQRDWARKLIGAGADLIVGAHPHVLQPVEALATAGHSGVVAYSLGNFIFDQSFSRTTSIGAVLRVLLDSQGVALVAAAPIEITDGQPRPIALGGTLAQTALRALGAASSRQLQAWSWNGHTAAPVPTPPDTQLAARPDRLAADLRGDGRPVWATLDDQGVVEVRDGAAADAPLIWRNEEPGWRVARIDVGDADNDGRMELLLLLWQLDPQGVLRSHPFLIGWRGGRYRVVWGGGAAAVPIQDAAVGDVDGDGRQELVALEGGRAPGDVGQALSIWRWYGWGFQREWRSTRGRWSRVVLQDVTGDGLPEIVAEIAIDSS
jgi:poly-gamma-glutamate capsule biosynthesis protein CapA/YwtB (metallophosphatase superfamily)